MVNGYGIGEYSRNSYERFKIIFVLSLLPLINGHLPKSNRKMNVSSLVNNHPEPIKS